MDLTSIDPSGDGTPYPIKPVKLGTTVYNGTKGCADCGAAINPVQALNSDLCPSCNKRKAIKQLSNKMVGKQ